MNTKLLSLAILLFIFSSSLFSQSFSIGVKGGANLFKISGKSFKDEFKFGYHVGAFASIGRGRLAFQPEVFFNQVNLDTATNFSQVYPNFNKINNIKLNYLSIPLLLNYKVNKLIWLQAGPQFGVLLDQNKNLLQNGQEAFKSGNFSLVGGAQLNILKFKVYGRFVGGMTDLNNIGNSDSWKTTAIQLGVGIGL
jgi:hypothetical protein